MAPVTNLAVTVALLFAAANPFQSGPYVFTTIEIRSDDLVRDVRAFDEAALAAGFAIKTRNDRLGPNDETTKRTYQSPARCCLTLLLKRETEAPVLLIRALDLYVSRSRFLPEQCTTYARFREELRARIDAARVLREDGLPRGALGMKLTAMHALVLLILVGTPSTCRNKIAQAPAFRLTTENMAQDIGVLDRAAADAGFVVTPADYTFTHNNRTKTSVRRYDNGVRCCFQMMLVRWHEEPVLEVGVSDANKGDTDAYDPADCVMYNRFRAAVGAKFKAERIFYETAVCIESLPLK